MRTFIVAVLATLLGLLGCAQQEVIADFSTPEGAILMLEDACKKKDLEAAVAAKDFSVEARLMLGRMKKGMEADPEILRQTAEVLELAFRAEMAKGFPDFTGLKTRFLKKEKYEGHADILIVTERFTYPDGGVATQKLLVAQTANGWRVLNVIE